ncbi:MAG: signal transduction protein [Desulfobacteraceae bacterium IS3]|nr:MAG: signal transduction protein [Desulfobacteraceae bacterium IS3]HAO19830.1 signal transduction protein [Desulfobacteraceae bacterium]
MQASNIMDTCFHTINPQDTIADAVKAFQKANQTEKKGIFGLIVTDDNDHLVGMLSMYDILLFIQPKHTQIWGEMEDLDPDQLFDERLERVKKIQVRDIMSTDVVTISPDTHILKIADIMIKKHIRRIPVIENRAVVGIIYRAAVFYHLLNKFTD